jgi:hypothetical protein
MFEVILFALFTAFLVWKLKGILGKEDEGFTPKSFTKIKDITNIVSENSNTTIETKKDLKEKRKLEIDEEIKENLVKIKPEFEISYKLLSSNLPSGVFNIRQFLEGAETLFSDLLEARNSKDLSVIAPQTSANTLRTLELVIENEKSTKPFQKIQLVKVESIEIEDLIAFQEGSAKIRIKILSEQIRYSKEGDEVKEGSLTIPAKFVDFLTIERVLQNKNFTWVLTSIE